MLILAMKPISMVMTIIPLSLQLFITMSSKNRLVIHFFKNQHHKDEQITKHADIGGKVKQFMETAKRSCPYAMVASFSNFLTCTTETNRAAIYLQTANLICSKPLDHAED